MNLTPQYDTGRFDLMKLAVNAAVEAGKEILKIYQSDDFGVELKKDSSPLTKADRKAHEVILSRLGQEKFPVLSEESAEIPYSQRKSWHKFWLVDPLDGTKEFIKRNGEFTVNIALIVAQKPTLGVIYVPVHDSLYFGDEFSGSFFLGSASVKLRDSGDFLKSACSLPFRNHSTFGIVASRSHMNQETSSFISGLQRKHQDVRIVSRGSSLKLCMIAEGEADIYPRFGPTSEWDTAAGHAIVSAAGGKVLKAGSDTEELQYNKPELLNPWFIASKGNP